jgi:hypothetical protein
VLARSAYLPGGRRILVTPEACVKAAGRYGVGQSPANRRPALGPERAKAPASNEGRERPWSRRMIGRWPRCCLFANRRGRWLRGFRG